MSAPSQSNTNSRAPSPTNQNVNPAVVGQNQANVPPVPANNLTLADLTMLVLQLQQQHQDAANRVTLVEGQLGQAQQTIVQQEQEIQQLQLNAVPPVVQAIPVAQNLPGLASGTLLKNGRGDVIHVDNAYFVNTVNMNAMTAEARNAIVTPTIDWDNMPKMTRGDWMRFAASLAHYWTVGGDKPITAFLDMNLIEALAARFEITVKALGDLDRQLQIYEFLKAWWEKPEDNAQMTIVEIKKIELLPAVKGNVQMVVGAFVTAMKKVVTHAFTKPLLDAIRNQVFIKNWLDEFKTKPYSSFEDFYDHLKLLAKNYDDTTQQVQVLESSKPRQQEKAKNGNGGGKPPVKEEKKTQGKEKMKAKCKLCDGEHWAFALDTDYSKPFGDHIKWTCPEVSNGKYTVEQKRKVYSDRQDQVARRKEGWVAKKGAGGAPKKT